MSADLRLGAYQDALADVADGSVRLILTSPPYDNARTYEDTSEPVDFDALARFECSAPVARSRWSLTHR